MTWLRTIAREILGLFVDDGSYALLLLAWLALATPLLNHFAPIAWYSGPVLFTGLALILLISATRYARRH